LIEEHGNMSIFEYAQKMEKDGEAFYREIAKNAPEKGLKTIFLGLAEDEVKHYQLFRELAKHANPDYSATKILSNAKTLFQEMRERGNMGAFPNSQVHAYQQALETERKSEAFYREKAVEVETPFARDLLLKIADEEKKHQILLEHMIEFITKPDTWMESAEFRNVEDF